MKFLATAGRFLARQRIQASVVHNTPQGEVALKSRFVQNSLEERLVVSAQDLFSSKRRSALWVLQQEAAGRAVYADTTRVGLNDFIRANHRSDNLRNSLYRIPASLRADLKWTSPSAVSLVKS